MDEDKVVGELASINTSIRSVEKRLDSGTNKMDTILEYTHNVSERVTAVESACEEKHSGCVDLHKRIYDLPCQPTANGKSKLNITFEQLMKFGGFVALIATCGMVAWQTGGV